MVKVYVLEGDFTGLTRGRLYSGQVFDAWQHAQLIFSNHLESQHLGERKFKGKVILEAIFYLPFERGVGERKQKERDGNYATNKPTMSALLKAFEDLCTGMLFEEAAILVAVKVEKRLSRQPRLELVITEIE
jgi:Holliday junction resolvase RusA-like endonuclease